MQSCFLRCWLIGWVIAVFLPSALIAALGLAPHTLPPATIGQWPGAVWAVADAVAPAAKLLMGVALFAAFLLLERVRPAGRAARLALAVLGAMAAMLLPLALLPADWSRGFGVGLTGLRFDPILVLVYLAGGAVAGLVFALSLPRCLTGRSDERAS